MLDSPHEDLTRFRHEHQQLSVELNVTRNVRIGGDTDLTNEQELVNDLTHQDVIHQKQVDMLAGDFNGAAWRRRSGDDQRRDSTIEEAFANTNLPNPHGPNSIVETRWRSRRMVRCVRFHQATWFRN